MAVPSRPSLSSAAWQSASLVIWYLDSSAQLFPSVSIRPHRTVVASVASTSNASLVGVKPTALTRGRGLWRSGALRVRGSAPLFARARARARLAATRSTRGQSQPMLPAAARRSRSRASVSVRRLRSTCQARGPGKLEWWVIGALGARRTQKGRGAWQSVVSWPPAQRQPVRCTRGRAPPARR